MTPPNRAIGQLSEGTFESEATWWSVPGERPERPIEPLEQDRDFDDGHLKVLGQKKQGEGWGQLQNILFLAGIPIISAREVGETEQRIHDLTLGAAVGLFSLLGGRLWGTNGDLKARGFKSYSCTQSLLVLWASTAILQA